MLRFAEIVRLGLATVALIMAADRASGQYIDAVDRYTSEGKPVTIECFGPRLPGRFPAVFLLHGSGGLEQATGDIFREMAASLAARGYVAFIPHFFEKTNHRIGDPSRPGEYESWMAAIKDAVDHAATLRNVDADRVGFIGYSMGTNLALIQASRDPRVKALVNVSGTYPPGFPRKKMPPLLILHGSKDKGTPTSYVQKYQERLVELEVPHAVHIYKGTGHNFDAANFADATGRSARFFDRYLRKVEGAAAPKDPAPAPR